MFEENSYLECVKLFKSITSLQATELLSNKDLVVIYIGRETCPYCRKFVKKLSTLVPEINTDIYYINSANTNDSNLSSFRENHNIKTVPGFIISKNSKIEVYCDSSMPEEKILEAIKK